MMLNMLLDTRPVDFRATNRLTVQRNLAVGAYVQKSSGRKDIERYIADIFNVSYGAKNVKYQNLLCSLETNSRMVAALGLSCAGRGPLFCEQYLSRPLEDCVQTEFKQQVDRNSLMELGNLVASTPGQSVVLYLLVTAALEAAGVRYLVFSANREVRSSINRCGFDTRVLCDANPAMLEDEGLNWGTYYEGDPKVILADIRQAVAHGSQREMIAKLWSREALLVDYLADAIIVQRR
jgi:hypothetical protein